MKPDLLIIDDDSEPRESLRAALEEDFKIRSASSGMEGIQLLKQYPISLALVDIRMPDMNGIEVLREIKRIKPNTSVVLLSGCETIETARSAIRFGAADFLTKPLNVSSIRRVVSRCLEHGSKSENSTSHLNEIDKINQTFHQEMIAYQRSILMNEFYGGVVHDLNNPLLIISGHASLICEELSIADAMNKPELDSLHSRLQLIKQETKRVSSIAQRLLTLSRPPASKPDALELNSFIQDYALLLKAHPSAKKKNISVAPHNAPITVEIFSCDLLQVFLSIGINGLQSISAQGNLSIEIKTGSLQETLNRLGKDHVGHHFTAENFNPAASYAIIQITDCGVGMSKDVVDQTFTPYFTTKSETNCKGLGLSVSSWLLEKYQGAILLSSKAGTGTSAYAFLPYGQPGIRSGK